MKKKNPFKYNKFKYTEKGIEYPSDRILPNELYKYYSLNKNSFDCVVNEFLFFSHPEMLNDLIDSTKFLLDFSNCDEEKYNGIMKYLSKTYEGRIEKSTIPSFEEAKSNNFEEMSILINYDKFSNKGTLSLSENKYDTLMMAHYANESGFVLELDVAKLEKHLNDVYAKNNIFIYPMNYDKKVARIDYFKNVKYIKKQTIDVSDTYNSKLITKHDIIDLVPTLYMTSIKDDVWTYEKEWRILLRKGSMGIAKDPLRFSEYHEDNLKTEKRKINYNGECLKKIILGPLFLNNKFFKEKIFDINKINNYFLNIEYLTDEKLLDSFRQFLKIISSEKFVEKVYLQNIQIDEKGFKRYSLKLKGLSFKNDVFSFISTDERY
ncbi:DUF2971 domain-containing protein [Flavobacterium sp. ZT3P35]|uniref:DUF2971 domain-containing protein n=1 Tax=Flavobacterium sp. ZT3P35 TaxID=3401727 RepID=UPI003AAA60F9